MRNMKDGAYNANKRMSEVTLWEKKQTVTI